VLLPVLGVVASMWDYSAVAVKQVTATSTFLDKRHPAAYQPQRVLDFEPTYDPEVEGPIPKTAWCEGKPDEGVGEGITITLGGAQTIDSLNIAAGVWLSPELFATNNKPTSLAVSLDNGPPITVTPSQLKRAWAQVPVHARVQTIAIHILGVAKGKMNDTCLSGVQIVRGGVPARPLFGWPVAAADSLPGALKAIDAGLSSDKLVGLDALLDFPFTVHDVDATIDGHDEKFTHRDFKSVVDACAKEAKYIAAHPKTGISGQPVACPSTVRPDPANFFDVVKPDTVKLTFSSHRDYLVTWLLHWTGFAWKLKAIDYDTVSP
jgi:hypothetical protein